MSQPRYPSPITPAVAIDLLGRVCATSHHEFWSCDVSVLDDSVVDRSRVHGPRQVTDSYLLALAAEQGGRFVTFDRTVALSAVPAATPANLTVL